MDATFFGQGPLIGLPVQLVDPDGNYVGNTTIEVTVNPDGTIQPVPIAIFGGRDEPRGHGSRKQVPGLLARKLRDWRIHVHPREIERWMAGDVFQSTNVDAPAIGCVVGLSEEESYELFTALYEDSGTALDAWKQAGRKDEPGFFDPYRDRNQPDRRTKSTARPDETREEVIEYLTKDYGMDRTKPRR